MVGDFKSFPSALELSYLQSLGLSARKLREMNREVCANNALDHLKFVVDDSRDFQADEIIWILLDVGGLGTIKMEAKKWLTDGCCIASGEIFLEP